MAKNGYVHLLGYADSLMRKEEIASIVQSVPGVQMVTNHIRIKPWEEKRKGSIFKKERAEQAG